MLMSKLKFDGSHRIAIIGISRAGGTRDFVEVRTFEYMAIPDIKAYPF